MPSSCHHGVKPEPFGPARARLRVRRSRVLSPRRVHPVALIGRANPHTFIVIAEKGKDGPWDPYHVSQGFAATDSCVSVDVIYGHTYGRGSPYVHGGGAVAITTPEMIVNNILGQIARDRMGCNCKGAGGRNRHLVVLDPETAQEMKSRPGFTREKLIEHLYREFGTPYEQQCASEIDAIRKAVASGDLPKNREEALKPKGRIPVLCGPEDLHVIVSGGYPGYSMTMIGYRRGLMMNNQRLAHMTERIRLREGGGR